jgi:hypothetical protein
MASWKGRVIAVLNQISFPYSETGGFSSSRETVWTMARTSRHRLESTVARATSTASRKDRTWLTG